MKGKIPSSILMEQLGPKFVCLEAAAEETWKKPALMQTVIDVDQFHNAGSRWHVGATVGAPRLALDRKSVAVKLLEEDLSGLIKELHHFLEILEEFQGQTPVLELWKALQAGYLVEIARHFALVVGGSSMRYLLDEVHRIGHGTAGRRVGWILVSQIS